MFRTCQKSWNFRIPLVKMMLYKYLCQYNILCLWRTATGTRHSWDKEPEHFCHDFHNTIKNTFISYTTGLKTYLYPIRMVTLIKLTWPDKTEECLKSKEFLCSFLWCCQATVGQFKSPKHKTEDQNSIDYVVVFVQIFLA